MTLGHTHHDAFEHIRTQHIASLAVDVSHYRHKKTGALHYHLASESDENVFLVALRTVPQDSTGVAHILEHTALCGSKKYPVRDPFFMMLRRSLNTFMNAFTSSDWTAYPFASQTPKDFENLLRIYLDAVFFSNLDPLDFAQEGHRIELSEPGDTDSPLVYKGVVFNEMKGAMSSVNSTLWQALSGELFDNTYHYNSGGDPENITDLSYDQLKQFYQTHYHPSNAIFMTFGNIPAAQHQAHFEALALREFDKSDAHIEVDLASAYTEPKRVSQPYSLDDSDDLSAKTHHVVGWKLGESTDLMAQLEAHLITNLLLENSASPLMAALETSDLGTAPSPLCGLEDSMREMVFCCGVAGSEPERAEAVEALILSVLETCATEGFPSDSVDAVLHQLELHQREITGDGMPYGLNLILQGLSAATHYADPVQLLNLEPAIAALKDKVKDADYLPGLVRSLLLDNPHRVTLTLEPDTELTARKQAAEAQKLEAVKASLTPEQLLEIDEQAKALLARQANVDDSSILPKVTKEDVAPHLHEPESQRLKGTLDVYCYPAGTNGLVYREMIAPIAEIDSQDLAMVPLYADFLTEVGLGNHDYLDVQRRQSATVGGIHAHTLWRTDRKADGQIKAYFALSAKALVANAEKQVALMSDTLAHPKFTEHKRLKELVSQRTQRRLNSITGSGHSLAMSAAAAAHDPLANLHDYLSGLRSTQALKALNEKLNSKSELEAFAEKLGNIHTQLCAGSWRHLVIGEEQHMSTLAAQLVDVSAPPPSGRSELTQAPLDLAHSKQLWLTNTQVYFCAKAYKTVNSDHEDGPALTVLGGLLRNGFLHRAIREQGGAYGGGASQDSGSGVFRFYSYRDPRFGGTLDDFDASLAWLRRNEYTDEALEEAILGVIASLDKPGSPAGTCKQHFHNRLFDRTHQDREAFRLRILACSRDDIERAANRYFDPNSASIAVVAPKGTEDTESALVGTLGLRCFQV